MAPITPKSKFADRYRQTRDAHAGETAEDYVEAIFDIRAENDSGRCRIVDLARRFGVSHVTVNKIIKRLQRERLVEAKPYGPIELTDQGRRMGIKAKRRHKIVFEFLLAIGVDEETAAIDSEGIEHHVSAQTLNAFKKFVARQK